MKKLAFVFLVFFGCGGDGPPAMNMSQMMAPPPVVTPMQQGPTAAQKAAAMMKCEALISIVCTRLADCYKAAQPTSDRDTNYRECIAGVRTELDCGAAVGVGDSYDRCVKETNEQTCSVVLSGSTPASCRAVIQVSQ